jgi:hypothetical protein
MRALLPALALAALLLVGCDPSGKSKGTQKPLGEPVARLDADRLCREYAENAVGADSKYKGKTIAVQAHLFKLWAAADGRYQLDLGKPDPDPPDWDRFNRGLPPDVLGTIAPESRDAFGKVKPDQVILVAGICRGMKPSHNRWKVSVTLDRCELRGQ